MTWNEPGHEASRERDAAARLLDMLYHLVGILSAADQSMPADPHSLTERLARADAYAAEHRLALTQLRRQVYALVAAAGTPIGAYDLQAALEPERGRVPPTTVYRALEFLVEHGFVHRIESRNAFVACCEIGKPHQSQFLICERCGDTLEIPGEELAEQLSSTPPAHGFEVHKQVVELSGLCSECKRKRAPTARR
jgi:Fur family zinc uptake transcriptional regulator